MTGSGWRFKIADAPSEIDQIHRLNYETFVEEVPQHHPNPDRRLIDKFHVENTYLIALHDGVVVGMMAARGNRPFSLDQKLDDLDAWLPPHTSICEFRLLAVRPEFRGGKVLPGLMELLNTYCMEHGHDLGIISGTTRQQKLYRHLGFRPFGPLVGTGEALFQPMYLTIDVANRQTRPLLRLNRSSRGNDESVSFLPGPVTIAPEVRVAFAGNPISHRGELFMALLETVHRRLCALTGALHVVTMTGSGTTANDAIAAQLGLIRGKGLVLANGEFGERLIDHARRFGLEITAVRQEWGTPFDYDAIAEMTRMLRPAWIWAVHCETSTGVLNDLDALKAIARDHHAKLALDCIGSTGTVPLDLTGVHFASATSGKGLASYAGIAIVFADRVPAANPTIPRSLDLGYFAEHRGVPFTMLSNHLAALNAALDHFDTPDVFSTQAALGNRARTALEGLGFRIVAPPGASSPAVLTLAIDPEQSSDAFGDALMRAGFLASYQSEYLRSRNWAQICLMGPVSDPALERLLTHLAATASSPSRPT